MMRHSLLTLVLICASLPINLPGWAQTPDVNDPWETYNRAVFQFNTYLDDFVLKPLAKGYLAITPDAMEDNIAHFFQNFFYPTTIVNQFLQGKFSEGGRDLGRLAVNTTLGFGGFFDPATSLGLVQDSEDFGQTLAVWGMKESPYVMVPLFGPSTLRDGLGRIPDMFTYPTAYIEQDTAGWIILGASIIEARAGYLEQEKLLTGDRYLFLRDAYLQRRNFLINDAATNAPDPFLDAVSTE